MLLPGPSVEVPDLKPGQLIAWEVERIGLHAVRKALRVVSVREIPESGCAPDERLLSMTYQLDVRDVVTGENLTARLRAWNKVQLLDDHYPVCVQCGAMWPCRDELIEIETRHTAAYLEARCVVCGDRYGARMAEVRTETPDGVAVRRYHTRKGSRCRTEYLKAIANDSIALAELRREDAAWSSPRKGAA